MAAIRVPEPVKPVYGLIHNNPSAAEAVVERIESHFGRVDMQCPEHDFTVTDYYCGEMGTGLRRLFLSVETLVPPDWPIHAKHLSNLWEEEFSREGRRSINIDPGYIGPAKLVLASAKNFSHRIYLGRGIYAEITMTYANGEFAELPWTYPDYARNKDWFKTVMKRYLDQRKQSPPLARHAAGGHDVD